MYRSKIQAKNILISHVYSQANKGDAALLSVLIKEVKREFVGAKITILTLEHIEKGDIFEGCSIQSSMMSYASSFSGNIMLRVIYGLIMLITTTSWAYFYKYTKVELPLTERLKSSLMLYKNADLVIGVGGGYLRTDRKLGSMYGLMLLLHPIALSGIFGRPTVLYSQSIGPFQRKIEKTMVKHVLNKDVELILLREDKSMQLSKSMGIRNAVRSIDAGFLLQVNKQTNLRAEFSIPTDKLLVGITVRKWLRPKEQIQYETAVAKTADYLINTKNAFIIFIPQVTTVFQGDDDRIVSRKVYSKMRLKSDALVLEKDYDSQIIKSLYNDLDFIIGTRFHSVIFSLTSYVPAIAIEYEYKTSGIMHDLGLDEWVINIEEVTEPRLIQKSDELISSKMKYKKHLRQVLPSYIKEAHLAIELTRRAYETFLNDEVI